MNSKYEGFPRPQLSRFCGTFFLCLITGLASAQTAYQGSRNPLLMAVAWKQTAAEYKALYYQAYNVARMQVDNALSTRASSGKALAVVVDMDDTILNTTDYWARLIRDNKDFFDDTVWDKWIPENKVVPTPGSLQFLNFCQKNGVEVFYITSRNQGQKTLQYALDHLKINSFPYADENHLTVLTETSDKQIRQDEIADRYEILLLLGDNLNDFKRVYYVADIADRTRLMERDKDLFGKKFILLPNPTDGHWIRAIFGESEPPATDPNRQILRQAAMGQASK